MWSARGTQTPRRMRGGRGMICREAGLFQVPGRCAPLTAQSVSERLSKDPLGTKPSGHDCSRVKALIHGHSFSIPAVVRARAADAALTACCQRKPSSPFSSQNGQFTPVFTFRAIKSSKLLLRGSRAHTVTSRMHPNACDSSLPAAMTRGGSSPARSGVDGFCSPPTCRY